ncbi:conserved hypothetical protein [Trichinella spiralis]|uniref:hypothetical protein n=1 Tax=Trichinella spiralis TaxID=6334 RepID=UPI0001EFBD58|nr:conserved hypothetical protein [Trichinella spiralis]
MPFNTIRTRPSLDRPSVALRLGSSAHPNSCLRNTGNTENKYCIPRILSQLLATNSSSCTTIVQLTLISRGALSSPIYRARELRFCEDEIVEKRLINTYVTSIAARRRC